MDRPDKLMEDTAGNTVMAEALADIGIVDVHLTCG